MTKTLYPESAHTADDGRARGRRIAREQRTSEPPADGLRGRRVRRLPRGDRSSRLPARPAGLAAVRRQRPAVSPAGRPRLDSLAERQLESRERNQGAEHVKEDVWPSEDDAEERVGASRRCLEHLWFDVKHRGIRYRMPVNDFAVPRMEPGKQRPIESMEEARDWERLFIGEIKAGRDPRIKPARKEKARRHHARGRLSRRLLRDATLKPAGIRSLDTAGGRLKVLKRYFGDLPVKALEEPAVINRFKAEIGVRAQGGDRHAAQGAGDSCGQPSAGDRRRRRRSSTSRRSTASVSG